MQFSAERIVITVFEVVGLRVRVRSRANILKVRFCKRTLVWRQSVLARSTGAEKNEGDERRENG